MQPLSRVVISGLFLQTPENSSGPGHVHGGGGGIGAGDYDGSKQGFCLLDPLSGLFIAQAFHLSVNQNHAVADFLR